MNLYLAGNDNMHFSRVAQALRYPYRLGSYYYMRDLGERQLGYLLNCMGNGSAEWIVDSGLFSLMFGTEQGTLTTYDDFLNYARRYIEDVKRWGIAGHRIVECDIQRVLGVKETHRLRDEVFRPSGIHTIYVWHIPEGEDGLARLAREERSIAISVPELRRAATSSGGASVAGGLAVKRMLIRLLSIIRDNGNPRVHLLGNTEPGLCDLPAESGDSTSWISGGRFGTAHYYDVTTRSICSISVYSPKWTAWRQYCERKYEAAFAELYEWLEERINGDDAKRVRWHHYYGMSLCSAIANLMWMEAMNDNDYSLAGGRSIARAGR